MRHLLAARREAAAASASSTSAGAISQPWRNRPLMRIEPGLRSRRAAALSGSAGRRLRVDAHDARLGQRRHHAVRGGHQLDRAAQRDRRAVLALDLARADDHDVAGARHEVDAVARMQQAQRARQAVAGRVQPDDLAAHAAHRQLRPRADAAHVEHRVEALRRRRRRRSAPASTLDDGAPQCHRTPCASPRAAPASPARGSICAFARQQPGVRGAVQRRLELAQLRRRQAAAARVPAGACASRASTRCAAPRSPRCASSRLPRCAKSPARRSCATMSRHSAIERQPSVGHLGVGALELGQRAQHAGGA